jgi:hypothetical protein
MRSAATVYPNQRLVVLKGAIVVGEGKKNKQQHAHKPQAHILFE